MSGQYLDVVPFLVNQKDVAFRVSRLLEDLQGNERARKEDPELLQHAALIKGI